MPRPIEPDTTNTSTHPSDTTATSTTSNPTTALPTHMQSLAPTSTPTDIARRVASETTIISFLQSCIATRTPSLSITIIDASCRRQGPGLVYTGRMQDGRPWACSVRDVSSVVWHIGEDELYLLDRPDEGGGHGGRLFAATAVEGQEGGEGSEGGKGVLVVTEKPPQWFLAR